jgi:hypothetical protein
MKPPSGSGFAAGGRTFLYGALASFFTADAIAGGDPASTSSNGVSLAKLTIGQKAERVLMLLLALRNPRIAAALKQHVFTNDDLDEGWTLLRALTRSQLDEPAAVAAVDSDAVRALDVWENQGS